MHTARGWETNYWQLHETTTRILEAKVLQNCTSQSQPHKLSLGQPIQTALIVPAGHPSLLCARYKLVPLSLQGTVLEYQSQSSTRKRPGDTVFVSWTWYFTLFSHSTFEPLKLHLNCHLGPAQMILKVRLILLTHSLIVKWHKVTPDLQGKPKQRSLCMPCSST